MYVVMRCIHGSDMLTYDRGLSAHVPAVRSGILDEEKSLSDVTGQCSAETCTWDDYTTLAVCASTEDVSSQGQIHNDSEGVPRFSITGTSWEPPSQAFSVPDTFWMNALYQNMSALKEGKLPPISEVFVAYYPQCNDENQPRWGYDQWKKQINDASNWKAFKGTLTLCLQTLSSTYNKTMNTTVIGIHKDQAWAGISQVTPMFFAAGSRSKAMTIAYSYPRWGNGLSRFEAP
jgi:hypothetical protein